MRKALVSLGAGPHERLLRIARPGFKAYAERHGYDLHLRFETPEIGRPAAWAKISILRELVGDYDAVFWIDADAVIVDGRTDITDLMSPERVLYLAEHRYDGHRVPNSGVMMVKGRDEGAAFLEEVWRQEQYINHGWWEQAAIMHLLGWSLDEDRPIGPIAHTPLQARTLWLEPQWNWAWFARVPHARIRHFPLLALNRRIRLMEAARAEAAARRLLRR